MPGLTFFAYRPPGPDIFSPVRQCWPDLHSVLSSASSYRILVPRCVFHRTTSDFSCLILLFSNTRLWPARGLSDFTGTIARSQFYSLEATFPVFQCGSNIICPYRIFPVSVGLGIGHAFLIISCLKSTQFGFLPSVI